MTRSARLLRCGPISVYTVARVGPQSSAGSRLEKRLRHSRDKIGLPGLTRRGREDRLAYIDEQLLPVKSPKSACIEALSEEDGSFAYCHKLAIRVLQQIRQWLPCCSATVP